MPKKKKKVCTACYGKGYLVITAQNDLSTVHGRRLDVPLRDVPEIQKCDACDMLFDDNMAQDEFLDAVKKGREYLPEFLLLWGGRVAGDVVLRDFMEVLKRKPNG